MLFFLPFTLLLFTKIQRPKSVIAGLSCIVVLLSIWTYQRNEVWRDTEVFWKKNVQNSPAHYRAQNNLGFALNSKGKHQEALKHFTESTVLKPDYFDARYNLGNALYALDRFKEAEVEFRKAIKIRPNDADAHNNLAGSLVWQGRIPEAKIYYNKALIINPGYHRARKNLSELQKNTGILKKGR